MIFVQNFWKKQYESILVRKNRGMPRKLYKSQILKQSVSKNASGSLWRGHFGAAFLARVFFGAGHFGAGRFGAAALAPLIKWLFWRQSF